MVLEGSVHGLLAPRAWAEPRGGRSKQEAESKEGMWDQACPSEAHPANLPLALPIS